MAGNEAVLEGLVERLTSRGDDPTSEPTWRFGDRMTEVYAAQMKRFEADEEASRWVEMYSEDQKPPPDDTVSMAEVAAQVAFYFPTHFFKFQKVLLQQLLEWESRQMEVTPRPFGAHSVTVVDIGSGVGTAALAVLDLLAIRSEVLCALGHRQQRISVNCLAVDPDGNKRQPRQAMLNHLCRLVDPQLVTVESLTDIMEPYPDLNCVKALLAPMASSALTLFCMANVLSSVPYGSAQLDRGTEPQSSGGVEQHEPTPAVSGPMDTGERVTSFGLATRSLFEVVPAGQRLLLAAEVDEQGKTLRSFARSYHPYLELMVRRNRVKYYSPAGCYWHWLESNGRPGAAECAVNYWSLPHWTASPVRWL